MGKSSKYLAVFASGGLHVCAAAALGLYGYSHDERLASGPFRSNGSEAFQALNVTLVSGADTLLPAERAEAAPPEESPPDMPAESVPPAAASPGAEAAAPDAAAATPVSGSGRDGTARDTPSGRPGYSDMDYSRYKQRLQAHIRPYQRYPKGGTYGVVQIGFILQRDGTIREIWVESSSGNAALDQAGLDTVRDAQPLPLMPRGFPDTINVGLPIGFMPARTAQRTVPGKAL